MGKKLAFSYDKEGDILDISIGKPKKATSLEVENDVFVRLDKSKQVVGFMILNFEKRFSSLKKIQTVPILADLKLSQTFL